MAILSPSDMAVFAAQKLDPHAHIDPMFSVSPLGLVWSDEVPRRGGLSAEGWGVWKRLFMARCGIHGGHLLTGEVLKFWNDAKESVKWIGFSRLTLTPEERAIYDEIMHVRQPSPPRPRRTLLDFFKELIDR
jgi:hypothetical protein